MSALSSLFSTTRLYCYRAVGAEHGSVVLITVEARRAEDARVLALQEANGALPWNGEIRFRLEVLDTTHPAPTTEVVWRSPLDRIDVESTRAAIVAACTPKEFQK